MNLLIFLPMASPEIVMGSSLLALFVASGFGGQLGFWTILIAHIMFCLSFVVVTVRARLAGMDDNLEQAAMDLYATEWQTFWRVTFPLVFPGILGAALLAFSLSFDDFIITNLNAGTTTTFPMYVWGVAQRGVPMQVNVVGTVMFVDRHRDRARRRGRRRRQRSSRMTVETIPHWLRGARWHVDQERYGRRLRPGHRAGQWPTRVRPPAPRSTRSSPRQPMPAGRGRFWAVSVSVVDG